MLIKQIDRDTEKERIARLILESLPEWFGIPQAREEYIAHSRGKPFFCAFEAERPVGFLYLKETGRHTVEVAVMGVARECHRQGIGRSLFEQAREKARRMEYSFIQVKTVQMGRYDIYDDTNRFYLSLGFRELEVFPTLWDEANPCQVYIMAIGKCQRRVDGDILLEPYYPNESVIELAKEKGMRQVKANIYAFNKQSQRMFQSIGFRPAEDEWYIYEIE